MQLSLTLPGDAAATPGPTEAPLQRGIHRVNNFLSVVHAQAEVALARGDEPSLRRALEVVVAQARRLEADLRDLRP